MPRFGDRFRNPALGRAYRAIAQHGPAAFYEGELAERIAAKSAELGGCLSLDDLTTHTADWVEPVGTGYRGYEVWELPPNGQGIAVLQILNLLEHFDPTALEIGSAQSIHLMAEAVKLAYADRARYYADPAFAAVPVESLISKAYAEERVALIDPGRASTTPVAGSPAFEADTVYLTAADRHGNMVSLIQSVFAAWGSLVCPDDAGFVMQNRGAGFSLDPSHANRLEPGKRPFHTIIPGFVTQSGRPRLAFGVMGGSFQPQGQVQVLSAMLDHGLSPQQAGDRPRAGVMGTAEPWDERSTGARLALETGFGEAVLAELTAMGHVVEAAAAPMGGYQAIWRDDEPLTWFGGSDPRKDGCALGY
jgi:gamma-glutamyltranspeptidase/glutathione hydrolase